jgi:hypothetical protein
MKVTLITFAAGDGITMGGDRGHIQNKTGATNVEIVDGRKGFASS